MISPMMTSIYYPQSPRTADSVCLSESCVVTAASLLQQMDRTADPCVDFNRFTCGGFIDKHRITLPAHKTRISTTHACILIPIVGMVFIDIFSLPI